jgi:hypothetical protein
MITFFKTPKPRQFNYKPFYYNQKEEELKQKLKNAEQNEVRLQPGFLKKSALRNRKKQQSTSTFRLLLIIAFLLLLTWYFIFR